MIPTACRSWLRAWALVVALVVALLGMAWLTPAHAESATIVTLQRSTEPHVGVAIDYAVKVNLPKAVVEAMQRGVPVNFQVQATVTRPRWYWRDERVSRLTRAWRVAYQPLTSTWRVTQGGLSQSFSTLDDAIYSITRASNWMVAEPQRVEADERYIVQLVWQLDTSQLPAPLQIGIGSTAQDWAVRAEGSFGVIP